MSSICEGSFPTINSEASRMTPATTRFATSPGYVVISPQPVRPSSVDTSTNTRGLGWRRGSSDAVSTIQGLTAVIFMPVLLYGLLSLPTPPIRNGRGGS